MLSIRNLRKSYGTKEVLKGISFTFESGQVYGIVGKNGAGKSTLFKCLSGLEHYDGEIDSDYNNLRHRIGLLYTNPIMMTHITGWEYLKLLTSARGIKSDDFYQQNIFDLPLDEYASLYSTGMKKKLAFMGILLQKNDVFILDEPFNGVDIQSNIMLTAIIQKLKEQGKTILISSHVFSSLQENCDEICLLSEGVISQHVSHEDFAALEQQLKQEVIEDKLDQIAF